jgi:hypothetical protein
MICGKISCSAKQGIFCDKQGISGAEQGNLFAASVNDPTGELQHLRLTQRCNARA